MHTAAISHHKISSLIEQHDPFLNLAVGRMETEPLYLWYRLLHISLLLEYLLVDRVARCGVAWSRHGLARGRSWSSCDDVTRLLWGLQDHSGLEQSTGSFGWICGWLAGKTHMAKLRS